MSDIVKMLREKPDLHSLSGASPESINQAEEEMNLKFANEYRDYLVAFGAVSFDGHEFTGVCSSSRLDVVRNTISERERNPNIPVNWYVVEQVNIDDIVVWQSDIGTVYQSSPQTTPIKLCNSLCEYIEL